MAMTMEYRSEGIGTICYVHPSGGWCSVIWDETGRERESARESARAPATGDRERRLLGTMPLIDTPKGRGEVGR